jgi:malic enzyme
VIEYVKPTALVGLSTTYNAFKEPMVRRMAELNQAVSFAWTHLVASFLPVD